MRQNTNIYDVNNFIYLAAMMKSSSTLVQLVLSSIQEPNNRPDNSKIEDAMTNEFMPMSVDFLESFPRGGVFKNHAPMEHHNNYFLKQTGCKYVILMRHPADHLAAFYCHQLGLVDRFDQKVPEERLTPWEFAAGQTPMNFFESDPEMAIGQLIECGYLFKILLWMSDWIAFRHLEQSRLVRYEDVIGNFEAVVTNLCRFIRGVAPNNDLLGYLIHVFNHETAEGNKKNGSKKYPRGWTGHIDTWKSYFSAANIGAYNRVIDNFKNAYPQAGGLAAIYPDLNISASA